MTLTEQYQLAVNRLLILNEFLKFLKLIHKLLCSVKSKLINCLI